MDPSDLGRCPSLPLRLLLPMVYVRGLLQDVDRLVVAGLRPQDAAELLANARGLRRVCCRAQSFQQLPVVMFCYIVRLHQPRTVARPLEIEDRLLLVVTS